jgi:hypothetical protein
MLKGEEKTVDDKEDDDIGQLVVGRVMMVMMIWHQTQLPHLRKKSHCARVYLIKTYQSFGEGD